MSAIDDYLNGMKEAPSSVAGPPGLASAKGAQSSAMDQYLAQAGGSFTAGQQESMTGAPQMDMRSWYTGQNLGQDVFQTQGGTTNGWNTQFQETFQNQYDEAIKRGDVFGMFARPEATGVVTWDNAEGRNERYKFGDIIVQGERVGNVYDDFDRHTANVMMGEYTVQTGARKAELSERDDREQAWEEEIRSIREKNTQMAEVAPRAKQFQENVEDELAQDSTKDRWAISAGGATGTAAMGAGIGTLIAPGVGTLIGGGAGFVLGGLGAWLNSDSLAYQWERNQEKFRIASREGAAVSAALEIAGETSMSVGLSPVSNLLQGTYDFFSEGGVTGGEIGGAFHAVDEEGNRKAGMAWQIADLGAMLTDSALQFASPLGRIGYQGSMLASVGGGVGGLFQGSWDDELLRTNSVFTREEFNPETGEWEEHFDLGNSLAGIGNVAIDAVQMGAISSLSRQSDRLAAQVAARTGTDAAKLAKPFKGDRFLEKLNLSGAQRQALKEGAEIETRSGYKFVIKDGEIVGKQRATFAMLAPSEGLQALTAKMLARRDAAVKGGAVTSESLYNAAADLAMGQRNLVAILANAVGEGQEEVAQALLEPWSQDHAVDVSTLIRSGLAGAVSGAGMTLGARLGRPSQDLQMFAVGQMAWASQTNGELLTKTQWDRMDPLQKRTLVKSAGALAESVTKGALDKIEKDRTEAIVAGVVGAARYEDYVRAEDEAALKTGTSATDQAAPLVMHESSTFRPDAMATSHTQLLQNQEDRTAGAAKQLAELDSDLAKATASSKADPQNAELAALVAERQAERDNLAGVLEQSRILENTIRLYVEAIDAKFSREGKDDYQIQQDASDAEALIDGLNESLAAMFDMTGDTAELAIDGRLQTVHLSPEQVWNLSKAVSRMATRDPADSTGSWQVMLPQIHKVFAYRQADGVYGVSQIILKAIRGDYDGDKMRQLQQVVQSDKDYRAMRSGANILGAGLMPEIASTKFERAVGLRVMQSWDSNNLPMRAAARQIQMAIEAELFARYHNDATGVKPISVEVIAEVSEEVGKALATGGDVREAVLKTLSASAGGALQDFGNGKYWQPGQAKLSNEMFWLANMVTKHMQEFQSYYAEHTPNKGVATDDFVVAQPSRTTTDVRRGVPRQGATEGQTMIQELPGTNEFRMFQKLHYTLWETTDKFAGFAENSNDLRYRELVQHYEALSQGVLEQRLNRKSPSDVIIGQVMDWLEASASDPTERERLGLTEVGDMALVANMNVGQMVWDRTEAGERKLRYTGKQVTLAQHLLYLSLEKFKRDNLAVWDQDTNLRAAYNNLFTLTKPPTQGSDGSTKGNAEMAFVRIFDGVSLYELIGADAVSLGVNLTVGQYYKTLKSLSVSERREAKYRARSGVYKDAESGMTIPYGSDQLEDRKVSTYKSVVDSLFSAADSSITMNLTGKDKGAVHGRDARKSQERGEAIQDAWIEVQGLLRRLMPKTGKYTAEDIAALSEENREFGQALLATLPDAVIPWAMKRQLPDGRVVFSKWFYEVWAQPTAKQAEMSYFRNYILDSWYAKVRTLQIDFANGKDDATQKRIEYDSLDSRMHRVLFRLASRSGVEGGDVMDPFSLNGFLAKFNEAQDVEKFMRYVNTEEGLNTEGAPLLPWMDDVAEFDPHRSKGGWSQQLTTPTLIEHINDLKATSRRLVKELDASKERSRLDVQTARSIQRWHRHLQDPNNQDIEVLEGDEQNYGRFVALLQTAAKRRMANGPRAMLQHTAHLVHGMYAPAHAKGQNAEQMAANAALEAMDNAMGYLITAERILGDLTVHNENSVADAPQMLLKDGGRLMNRDGRTSEWELNSVDAMLPLMLDEKNHNVMRAVLFDTVMELDTDGRARRKFLMGSTLDEVMTKNTVKDLFDDEGRNPGLTESMQFLVKLEADLRDSQKHEIEQRVTELVIARTTALDHTASFEEIQEMTVQAYMDFATVVQTVARTQRRPGEPDPVTQAYEKLKEASAAAAIASAYGVDPKLVTGNLKDLQPAIELELIKPLLDRIDRLRKQIADTARTKAERRQLAENLKAEESNLKEMQKKVEQIFDLNVTDQIVEQYHYSSEASAAEKHARQEYLMQYVYERGELMQAAGPALPTVQAIKNHFAKTPKERKAEPFILPDKDWETLSSVIISVEIQHLLTVGPASKPPPPFPAALKKGETGLNKRKYWDHSFSYLFDFLSPDDKTGIVEAARNLAMNGGMAQQQFGEEDVIQKVKDVLMREGTLGTWGPEVPIQSLESYELLTGASAMPSISMHGLISQRWGAAMEAVRRRSDNVKSTVADATVELTAADLNWTDNGAFHDVTVKLDDGREFQRPLAQMNNRFASELSFTYGSATQPVDLMQRPNVARRWQGSDDTTFREVNLLRLSAEIEKALREMYPGTKDAEMQKMLRSVKVRMKFVNPDSQQATAEHANSVWHEGTVYDSDGDVGDSLLRAFFYGVGALNARGQQAALDTRKLGTMGIEDYKRPAFAKVLEIEKNKNTDFARMLALKTNELMDTPISEGKPIDLTFYNAAYKLMKLKHWVDGVNRETGKRERWSAEQVIAWQMANPETDPTKPGPAKDFFGPEGPLRGAELWMPSDQVLANMMGDIGYGGVDGRALRTEQTDDLTTIRQYDSRWTDHMEAMFPVESSSVPVTLLETDVARQSYVQDLKVNTKVTSQEQMRFQRRVASMELRKTRALDERREQVSRRSTFRPKENRAVNMDRAVDWVVASDVDLPGLPPEFRYLQREHGDIQERVLTSLQRYMDEQEGRAAKLGSSFWIFQETGTSSADEGRLTRGDLNGKLNLVPGEVVFFDTAAYAKMDPDKGRELARKRIDYFVNQGVALMIGSSEGPNNVTSELQRLTQRDHRYQRYLNNNQILVPDVFDQQTFQNVSAQRSRLVTPSGVRIPRQRLSVALLDKEIEENTMMVPVRKGRKTKFDAIQAAFDLLPVDAYADFATAVTGDDALKVQRYLEGLDETARGRLREAALGKLKGAERDKAEEEFEESWKRLMAAMPDRVRANTTRPITGEKFGTGDFIPLLNPHTNEILLYRHGYKAPKPQDFQSQLRGQTPGAPGMLGVAVYTAEREPSATTHRGTVVDIKSTPGRGFRMELEIPVQELGEKIVFEHNGMKYLRTALSGFTVPDLPLFGDLEIDGYTSLHDVISKEATDGLVSSFGQAFTVFGIDFTQDLKDFFGLDSTDATISLLKRIARIGEKRSVEEVYQLQSMMAGQDALFSAISGLLPQLAAANVDTATWAPRLQEDSATAAIGRAMLTYLMSPGADVDAVLGSSGFHHANPTLAGAESQKMPELFTRAFDLSAPNSAIRAELGERINAKLNKNRGTKETWHLDVNSWELEGAVADGSTIRGMLQYGEAYASEDNVLLNLMAQERKDKQSMTRHQALMNRIGTGGITRTSGKKLDRLTGLRQQDLTDPEQVNSLWHDLTFVDPTTYGPGSRWQRRNPAEVAFYNRSIARMTQYRKRIDMDDSVFDDDRKDIEEGIQRVVNRMGLRPSQDDMVHYWIRQMLYNPAEGPDQEAYTSDRSPKDILGALAAITKNLDDGFFPTYNGAGPSFFSYDDLSVLFTAYQRGESKWAPYRKERDRSTIASREDIGEWIAIAFGQAINGEVHFDPMYRLDEAGFMNTYQTVLRNSGYMMDITFDKEYQRKLLDPKTNELLSVTLDPVEHTRLTEQVLFATAGLEYEDLMRGAYAGENAISTGQAAAWRQRRLKALAAWRARNKVHPVKAQSTRDFVRNGIEHINKDADQHSLQRIVIALRHGTAMLNPGLYFSMIPEQGFRMFLSEATHALTGESTMRSVSALQRGVDRATGGRMELAQYSKDQISDLNELFKSMGNDGAFTSLIIKDMMWQKNGDSPGRIVRGFERYAALGNKWQDPTWGTTQKSVARHYVEAIVRSIEAMPTRNVMTIDSVIAHLRTDPSYFARELPELHKMASNAVVDFRSLKQTPMSLAMRRMYEPWATSDNSLKRFGGTLLKLQAMYATYNMNVLTTITGMQGYSDMLAAFLDKRETPGSLMNRWWKARNGEQITDEDNRTFDMSSAIDGVNIAQSFIKGGITQTGLFMLGAVAGGILSGEDDEAKRRRKLAEAQNAPLLMDPRRLEADFRNKDVLFLDWLPEELAAFFRVQGDDGSQGARSAAQMSWILKPFLSPILGMERFFMTGDFDYITHGFADAVGSMPLFNKNKWDDAARTADELASLAAEEQKAGTPTAQKNTLYFLASAVGVYESMLVENMFLNSLYTGWDQYDRDPTKLVLRDSDGVIQRTIEGDARKNDVALQKFPGDNGQVETGYMKRDTLSANLAAYTENNFTAAAMLSMFKPIHHQEFFRGDMPVRERVIKLPELSEEEAKLAVVLATIRGQADQNQIDRRLSLDEVTYMLKGQFMKDQDWESYNNIDALALQFYNSDRNPVNDPLSYVGPDGQELLTKSGHAALFKGLMGGTIDLDSPEMLGIAISPEQRIEIEKDFYRDMVREGRDLGLTQQQAQFRATRLLIGPKDDPAVKGFKEILWDERIPWTPDARYKQLNTTYVQGPDGFPWATGYRRGAKPGNGMWQLIGGLKRPNSGSSVTDAITEGGRMNSQDQVRGINTGQRGLVPSDKSELIPTDWEQTQDILDAIKDIDLDVGSGYEPNSNGGGKGTVYRGGYRYGGGSGGGYSSRGYSPTIYWSRQANLPRGTNVYGNSARNLFWDNGLIRRSTIRRERYQASRGRLKQWQ